MTRKQTVGENLLYVMVWAAIILVPVLNSQMMSELHISFENVLIAWRQIAPYFIIFIIHNSVLAPRLMLRRKYKTYLLCDLALIIAVFWLVGKIRTADEQVVVRGAVAHAAREYVSFGMERLPLSD